MASISFKNVNKTYDNGVTVIDGLNLDINDKEFVVLVGPSGCGKSTTLRMIAGLEDITSGDLYIGDQRVNDVEPKNRDIAFVFQSYALYPHMTVYRNMAFALELRKVPKDEIDRRVREAAKILEIEEYLDRKPKALSGGQRQRVALGRAIVRDPKVFLLDEPLSNLDAKLRAGMRSQISELHKRLGTTFVYVTHDQTEAMTLGDRIVIMKDGVVQQVGTPTEVYDSPANIFVAGFIGVPQMNFYEGQLLKENGRYFVKVEDAKIELSEDKQAKLAAKNIENRAIIAGVRPEHIALSGDKDKMVHGKVDVSEMMGSSIHVHINALGKDGIIVVPTIDARGKKFEMGEPIDFTFTGDIVNVFDKETGVNIGV